MIYIHDYTAQGELSSTALELGGNLQEGKMVDLEYVLPYLPELDDYEYTDYVWVFKTIGNIEPHVDEDYGTHSLFILLDKFCLSYLDNNFLFIIKHIHINVMNNNNISIIMSIGGKTSSVPIAYKTVATTLYPQNKNANMAISQLDKFFIYSFSF